MMRRTKRSMPMSDAVFFIKKKNKRVSKLSDKSHESWHSLTSVDSAQYFNLLKEKQAIYQCVIYLLLPVIWGRAHFFEPSSASFAKFWVVDSGNWACLRSPFLFDHQAEGGSPTSFLFR